MANFWVTINVPTIDQTTAERIAARMASKYQGSVIDVQPEPPQGSTVVGDMHEDEPPVLTEREKCVNELESRGWFAVAADIRDGLSSFSVRRRLVGIGESGSDAYSIVAKYDLPREG